MNFTFLPFGPWGVACAALISLAGGFVVHGLMHAWGRRQHWSHAREIALAWVVATAITAGADTWNLFYMGIVPMQSPVTMERLLSAVHDPDTLGTRVVCEFVGAAVGVMLGWSLWVHARGHHPAPRPD